MKLRFFILFTIMAGLMASGCRRKMDPEEQRLAWSTESPLSIPYHTRFQRFEKKNLIRNYSFETGRTFKLDTIKTSYVMDGWQQMGEEVEWVDTRQDSLYSKNEAFSGFRSVKIIRKQAYETDEKGEGILSDFIKVIPGNYSLSFYTRLQNIRPVKGRLGIKMYDAVDIRLLFFDKSKIAIDPARSFPQLNQFIDNSFKSLSLANFSSIPLFGWGKIIGKSADFPFSDGDIPTNAHYVKIFIGLKGTGTMWIDSVNFSYTRKNFSIQERMLGYTDTLTTNDPFIIPTPKKMDRLESVIFSDPDGLHQLPVIIVPAGADSLVLHSAYILQNAFAVRAAGTAKKGRLPNIRIITAGTEPFSLNEGLTFILGRTSLLEKFRQSLPMDAIQGHSQGYFVYSPSDMPNVVFLDGNNSTGIYYAVLSAIQLIDEHQPVFHNARIVDFPDFEFRFFTVGNVPDISKAQQYARVARKLEVYKMNGALYQVKDSNLSGPGISPQAIRRLIDGSGGFRLAFVYSKFQQEPDTNSPLSVYAPQFVLPDDSSLCYPYPISLKSIKDPPAIIGKNPVGGHNPIRGFYLMAPIFNNQLLTYSNFPVNRDRNFPTSTCIYSGSSFFSLNTDDADFVRFISFAGKKPVFMDNSMLASSVNGHYGGAYPFYSGKIRLYNIFEPFLNTDIREFMDHLDTRLFWVNYAGTSELDVIRLSTAADFMWNVRSYDPDYSLWKVLTSRYGADAARALIHYADLYGLMLEIQSRNLRNEPIPRNLKNIQGDILKLEDATRSVEQFLGRNHPLVNEILSLNEPLKSSLSKFIRPAKP